jgi:hypothetical protein
MCGVGILARSWITTAFISSCPTSEGFGCIQTVSAIVVGVQVGDIYEFGLQWTALARLDFESIGLNEQVLLTLEMPMPSDPSMSC